MAVDQNEDRGSTVRVEIAEQVPTGYVSHDVLDGLECSLDVWSIMHCKEDTSY